MISNRILDSCLLTVTDYPSYILNGGEGLGTLVKILFGLSPLLDKLELDKRAFEVLLTLEWGCGWISFFYFYKLSKIVLNPLFDLDLPSI